MRWSTRSRTSASATSRCRRRRSGSVRRSRMAIEGNSLHTLPVVACLINSYRSSGGSMKKSFIRGTWQVKRAFSPAVITEGGRTIYVAGHTGQVDGAGKSLAGNFDAQFKQTFRNIEKTLAEAGAGLGDLVTMTVFLSDARHTTRMTEL